MAAEAAFTSCSVCLRWRRSPIGPLIPLALHEIVSTCAEIDQFPSYTAYSAPKLSALQTSANSKHSDVRQPDKPKWMIITDRIPVREPICIYPSRQTDRIFLRNLPVLHRSIDFSCTIDPTV